MATICARPGCPNVANSSGFCTQDQPESQRDPEQNAFYKSAYWKRLSAQVRREEPVCMECGQEPSAQTDHIDGDWRNNDRKNLRGIGLQCHQRKHRHNWHASKSTPHVAESGQRENPTGTSDSDAGGVARKFFSDDRRAFGPIQHFFGYASGNESVRDSAPKTVPTVVMKNPYEDIGF